MLRSVEWMVCDCATDFVIIGEPTLRALGLDNRALLEAACEKPGRDVDVPKLLENSARIIICRTGPLGTFSH